MSLGLLGIGLALANWISLIALMGEERALLATIGDSYQRYMSRTKRFVPFLF